MSEDKQTKMTSDANSDFLAVHEDVVKRVLETQPEDEYLYDLAELFKVYNPYQNIICFAGKRTVRR